MGVHKYVSDVKTIDQQIEAVFSHLSDFRNLSRYINEDLLNVMAEKVPQLTIRGFEADRDACRFEVGSFGKAEIRIVERTPCSTLKVRGEGKLPVEVTFWIQLLPVSLNSTKMRLTLHAEMGMMVGRLVGNKLEQGLNQLAEVLARLPYPPIRDPEV